MIAGTFSSTVRGVDGNVYLLGGDIEIQFHKSSSLIYTLDIGMNYTQNRHLLFIGVPGESYYEYVHLYYLQATLGFEYLPFKTERKLRPYLGSSISPTYFRSFETFYPQGRFIHDAPKVAGLLMANLELGCYYKLSKQFDLSFSIIGSYNLLSNWKYFCMLQSEIGMRYNF